MKTNDMKIPASEIKIGDTIKLKWYRHQFLVEGISTKPNKVRFFGKVVAGEDWETSFYPSGVSYMKTTKISKVN